MNNHGQRDPELLKEAMDLFRQIMMPLWHITRSQIHKLAIEGENAITSSQYHTIRQIQKGTGSVSELASCMHVSRPNISRSVDELVTAGIVERCRDLDDRRNIKLTLTENGEKLIQNLRNRYSEILADQFSVLNDKELKTMTAAFKSMKKIINNYDRK